MGKLTGAATAEDLFRLLGESAVLSPPKLEQARQLTANCTDLRVAAKALIKADLVTLWQAKQLVAGCTALKFGPYELLDELGHSELGRVYLAEHGRLNRRVALKILSRRLTFDPASVQRFLAEARVLSSLDHRNLIHVFDVGQEGDRYYLVLEYVSGRNAQQIVSEGGPLGPDQATRLVRQAVAGLIVAHDQGVVHGELKPDNLMLDEQGTVKLLGMGIAQLGGRLAPAAAVGDDSEEEPSAASLIGKLYRAPEQLAGESATAASDLYSVGAIWYLLLTGVLPAAGGASGSAADIARQNMLEQGNVPPAIIDLVAQLLQTDPQTRGGSIKQLARAIDDWLATQPPAAAMARPVAGRPPSESGPRPRVPPDSVSAMPAVSGGTAATGPAAAKPPPKRALPRAKALDEPAQPTSPAGTTESAEVTATPDADEAVASTAEPQFQIRTTPRPRSKPTAAGTKKSSTPATTSAGSSSKRRLLIVVGVVTAVLVIVGGSIGAFFAFFRDKPTPRPDRRTGPVALNADSAQADEAGGGDDQANHDQAAGAGSAGDAATPSPPGDTPADQPAGKKPSGSTPETLPKPDEQPVTPKPTGGLTSGEPGKPTPPPGDAKPDSKPEPKPEPTTPPNPESKPESKPAPPPEPKPEDKPPPANPFQSFPKIVNLPPLDKDPAANQPTELGKITIDPKAICVVHLLGGVGAVKAKQRFALEAAENGTALRDWEIFLREAAATAGGVKIAHLSLQGDTLKFQWTPEAIAEPSAPGLMNCVLNLATGPRSQAVALRSPVVAEPMKVDLLKGGTAKWDIPHPPDPDKIQLQVLLEGGFPAHKVEGVQPMSAEKGSLTFAFQMGDRPEDYQVLALKLDVTMRKSLTANAAVWFKPFYSVKPEKLTANGFKKAQGTAASGQQQLFATLEFMRKANKQDELSKTQLAQVDERHNAAQRGLAQLEQVRQLIDSIGETGRIHVRAYYLADDKRVELLNTGGPEPPAKP